MKRRDFLETGFKAVAGSALSLSMIRKLHSQNPPDFLQIAEERESHPLYFDGLTFFGGTEDGVRQSGLSGFLWDISAGDMIDGRFIRQPFASFKSIAQARKLLTNNDEGLFLATKGTQIKEAHESGKTAVFLQFQSMEAISEDLFLMDAFYDLGLRIQQITHHYTNPFAGGSLETKWTGLTDLGYQAVERMNELNILPDLGHANESVAMDVIKTAKPPVIVSHTACRALVNNARCLPDNVIKSVADTGGVVGIFAMSFWLTDDSAPTVDSYVDQLEHVINIAGIDAVGIANDYDVAGQLQAAQMGNDNSKAVKGYYPWWKQHEGILGFDELPEHVIIPELNNVKRFFTIQKALEERKYSAEEIEKIMGGNWFRVLTERFG